MEAIVRKQVTYVEDVYREAGKVGSHPLRQCAVAAVIQNPWAGRGYVDDLKPGVQALAEPLAKRLVAPMIELCGSVDMVEAFGKAALAGINADIEHGSALIHSLRFGNIYRDAVGGKSFLSYTNTRGGPNTQISIPLVEKNDSGSRPHYMTVQLAVPDAPGPDEIVIAIAAATGPRLNARIGDRYQDMAELDSTAAS